HFSYTYRSEPARSSWCLLGRREALYLTNLTYPFKLVEHYQSETIPNGPRQITSLPTQRSLYKIEMDSSPLQHSHTRNTDNASAPLEHGDGRNAFNSGKHLCRRGLREQH